MPDKGLEAFEKALNLYPEDSYQYFYISIGLSDCDSLQENFSKASERVEKLLVGFTDKTLLAVGHQALGEYSNFAGQREKAITAFEKSEELFGAEQGTKDYAYLKKHLGLYYFFMGEEKRALVEFKRAREILIAKDQTPLSLIEVYFWMEKIDKESLSLADRLALRVYPHYSLYAFLVGRERSSQDTTLIPNWLKDNFKAPEGNVWEISEGSIRDLDYQNLREVSHSQIASLDLVSGILRREGLPMKLLSPLQANLLISLIGGGERGVHEFLLLDLSYRQSFIDYDSALDRLKKAVSGLKEFGFRVQKEKMTYSLEINFEEWHLLIPRDLKSRLYYPYVMIHFPGGFQTQDLAKLFGLSRRTIQRWVKEWRDKNLIHTINPNQVYCWTVTSFSLDV
jgi:tetratricopeptide (TPR) repeat protein